MYYSLFCFPDGVKIINKDTLELRKVTYQEVFNMYLVGEFIDGLGTYVSDHNGHSIDIRDKSFLSRYHGFCYGGYTKVVPSNFVEDKIFPITQSRFQTNFDVCLKDVIIHTENGTSIIWYDNYYFHTNLQSCIGIHRSVDGVVADRLHIYPDDTIAIKETPLLELAQRKVSCSRSEFMRSMLLK